MDETSISPDGSRVAITFYRGRYGDRGGDGGVVVWDTLSGKRLYMTQGNAGVPWSPTFSADGKLLAALNGRTLLTQDGIITIWDAATGAVLRTIPVPPGSSPHLTFAPDGGRLAGIIQEPPSPSGGIRRTEVRVWDTATGQVLLTIPSPAADDKQHSQTGVAYSSDGAWLALGIASGLEPAEVRIHDAHSGEEHRVLRGELRKVAALAFHRDGTRLVAGGGNGLLCVWDLDAKTPTGAGQPRFTFKFFGVTFSPDGKRVASFLNDFDMSDRKFKLATLKIWDAATGVELVSTLTEAFGASDPVFGPDGKRLAGGVRGKGGDAVDLGLAFWDASTGQVLSRIEVAGDLNGASAFTPDGSRLVTGAQALSVIDIARRHEVLSLKGHIGFVTAITISPDGRRIASVDGYDESQGNELKLWDAETGRELLTLKGHHNPVGAIAFSRDGHRLLSAAPTDNRDGVEIRIWDATPLQTVSE